MGHPTSLGDQDKLLSLVLSFYRDVCHLSTVEKDPGGYFDYNWDLGSSVSNCLMIVNLCSLSHDVYVDKCYNRQHVLEDQVIICSKFLLLYLISNDFQISAMKCGLLNLCQEAVIVSSYF